MRANLTPTHCNVQTQSSEKCITDTFYEAKCAWNAWKNPIVAAAVQSVTLCAQCVRYCGAANYSVTCCIIFRLSLPLSSPIRCIWRDIPSILIIKSKKKRRPEVKWCWCCPQLRADSEAMPSGKEWYSGSCGWCSPWWHQGWFVPGWSARKRSSSMIFLK